MASISESGTGKHHRFTVRYRNEISGQNAVARPRTIDEAMRFFWQAELSERQLMPLADSVASVRRWTVQKAVWFWLGYQYDRVENNTLSLGSYNQYRMQFTTLSHELLKITISRLTPLRLRELTAGTQKYLRFAFSLLTSLCWLTVNPVGSLSGRKKRRVEVPDKKTIVAMLGVASHREKVAIWLGAVCGLRIGEALALRYSDVSEHEIMITRHLTPQGILPGTKNGDSRTVDMPPELFALLDKSLLGTDAPLLAGRNRKTLSLNYSKKGRLKALLSVFGVGRYHDLRHFAITNLIQRGEPVPDVAEFAGHKDASVTMETYAHLFRKKLSLHGVLNMG